MTFEILDSPSPAACHSVELDCCSCTTRSARDIASLCATLSASSIEGAFRRMYPSEACAEMLPCFAQAYFEATEPLAALRVRAASSTAAA
jgi:hypothetical protein